MTDTGKKRKLPSSGSANGTMEETTTVGNDGESIVEEISYVEFYSGVGGWTMALEETLDKSGPLISSIRSNDSKSPHCYQLKRLAALDHSDLCVKVFSHNFAKDKTVTEPTPNQKRKAKRKQNSERQKSYSIERMPLRQLEDWSADVWVMSPPCQPHTRQHNDKNHEQNPQQIQRKDLEDPRSKSFLKICEWLEGATSEDSNSKEETSRLSDTALPSLICLENVVGFESSNSFQKWRSALKSRGYRVGHFHLTPTQVGLPNDRPRFYSVAFRGPGSGDDNALSSIPMPTESISIPSASSLFNYLQRSTEESEGELKIWKAIPELQVIPEADTTRTISQISTFLDSGAKEATTEMLRVPDKVLKNQSAWCFDIVRPTDRRSSCFTHSYGRFIRGTGSILYDDDSDIDAIRLLSPQVREFHENWMEQLDGNKLRYFSGNELARLFGFSKNFSFPQDTSLKQQWKLMGNSLNVRVASKLVELGFLLRYYYCLSAFDQEAAKKKNPA